MSDFKIGDRVRVSRSCPLLNITFKHNGSLIGVITKSEQIKSLSESIEFFHVKWDCGAAFTSYPGCYLELIVKYEDDRVL